jgi:hypothetical protein
MGKFLQAAWLLTQAQVSRNLRVQVARSQGLSYVSIYVLVWLTCTTNPVQITRLLSGSPKGLFVVNSWPYDTVFNPRLYNAFFLSLNLW